MDPQVVTAIIVGSASLLVGLLYYRVDYQKKKKRKLYQNSMDLSEENVLELQVTTNLKEDMIRALYLRYSELDSDNSGSITASEFCRMKEMAVNPLAYRIFDAFDANDDGHLDFSEFIKMVTVMSHRGTSSDKLATMFSIYDVDGDGRISRSDLKYILELVTHRPKTKEELKVKNTKTAN